MKKQEPKSIIDENIQAINKAYGQHTLFDGNCDKDFVFNRISSGVFVLDLILKGGYPVGRFTAFYGRQQTGKTALCLRGLAQLHRTCGNCYRLCDLEWGAIETVNYATGAKEKKNTLMIKKCVCGNPRNMSALWLDVENAWDAGWAEAFGVILERVVVSKPETAEKAGDIVHSLILSRRVDLVVVDSIAQLLVMKEYESSSFDFDKQVGGSAKCINSALKKWISAVKEVWASNQGNASVTVPTIWLINQPRDNIGMVYGPKEYLPGGKNQRHITSVEIKTSGGKYESEKEVLETYTGEFEFRIEKSRLGGVKQVGKYRMCLVDTEKHYVTQVLDYADTLYHGIRLGFIERISDRKYKYDDFEFTGRSKITDFWIENPDEYERVQQEILKIAKGKKIGGRYGSKMAERTQGQQAKKTRGRPKKRVAKETEVGE